MNAHLINALVALALALLVVLVLVATHQISLPT